MTDSIQRDTVYADPSISVHHDANNNVTLTIYEDIVNERDPLRFSLSPDRAATLLRELSHQTTYALIGSAESIARGDCATCRNVRMVEVPKSGGRTESVHCPDCHDGRRKGGYPLRPQIGGGLA